MDADDRSDDDAPASPLVALVAEGIERVEREGPQAVDALCAEHPEHAGALRRRLAALGLVGLLEHRPSTGRYRVVRTLGRGGMGVVHLAHDERLGRLVALKALPSRVGQSPNAQRRFEREIEAVAKLRHPGIVPIYDVGDEGGTPYFTMEYVEGSTLSEIVDALCELGVAPALLRGGDLSPARDGESWTAAVADLAAALADGLQHAHAQGVVHRDVKPSNVLVDAEGRPRLFDFGLARVEGRDSMTLTGDLAGTPYYASPEQVAGSRDAADPRTDVYSLGVTLYELLTLQRPFTGTTTEAVLRQITSVEPPLLRRRNPAVPRDLESICLTALEKDPARRYPSAGEMADDLRRFLRGEPVRAAAPRPVVRMLRNARRHPARVAAAALALVLLVGGPIYYQRTQSDLDEHKERLAAEQERAELAAQLAAAEQERAALADAQAAAESVRAANEAERARLALAQAELDAARAADATELAHKWLRRADGLDTFMLSMLSDDDPSVDDKQQSVVDALRRGGRVVHDVFAHDPVLESEVRVVLGKAFVQLGVYEDAVAQFTASLEIGKGDDTPEYRHARYDALRNGSTAYIRLGRFEEACAAASEALALAREIRGPDSDEVTQCLGNLGRALSGIGRQADARAAYQEALLRLRASGAPDAQLARAMSNLAQVLPPEEADYRDELFAEAAAIQLRTRSADDYEDALLLENALWMTLQTAPDRPVDDEPVARLRLLVERRRAQLPPDDLERGMGAVLLAKVLETRADFDEAEVEALLREARTGLARLPASDTRRVLAVYWLGRALARQGRPADALPVLLEAVELRQAVRPEWNPSLAVMAGHLADVLRVLGRGADADALLAALGLGPTPAADGS